ncbi:MAG: hypothetical protein JWR24_1591 [Actinoallomurus sp.]|jgi:hypothetical protein|nr:hypothetical protein [Actinoallomurus sp.]
MRTILRDPETFTIRERRRLQRYLLELRDGPDDSVENLISLLTEGPVPQELRRPLREVVLAELPALQRAVHPAPGWEPR